MRDEKKVWQLMTETSASIYPLAQNIMRQQLDELFTERRFYNTTFTANNVAPEPISVDMLSKRNPYANPIGIQKLLAEVNEAGYIEQDDNGDYVVSEKGANAILSANKSFYDHINGVDQFPPDKRKELSVLLGKLVESCTRAELANGTLALEISHHGHPPVQADSLAQIDQNVDDMFAFRDDAHIDAWTPVGVSGHTWEVLSFVWNGEANTVEKLVERLPFRNYTADDYTKTLNDLTQRGWIEPDNDVYGITDAGKKIREDAENGTDNNFFGPWQALTDNELAKLGGLLKDLNELNTKIAEESTTE